MPASRLAGTKVRRTSTWAWPDEGSRSSPTTDVGLSVFAVVRTAAGADADPAGWSASSEEKTRVPSADQRRTRATSPSARTRSRRSEAITLASAPAMGWPVKPCCSKAGMSTCVVARTADALASLRPRSTAAGAWSHATMARPRHPTASRAEVVVRRRRPAVVVDAMVAPGRGRGKERPLPSSASAAPDLSSASQDARTDGSWLRGRSPRGVGRRIRRGALRPSPLPRQQDPFAGCDRGPHASPSQIRERLGPAPRTGGGIR